MGRHASGWKLRQRSPGAPFSVRFTWDGVAHEPSTGTADRSKANAEAARIYAAAVAKPQRRRHATAAAEPLERLVGAWLTAFGATHAAGTLAVYKGYSEAHWLPFFISLHNITDSSCLAYMRHRLRSVLAATVRQELVALRAFCGWLEAEGHAGPIAVPRVTKGMLGVPHPKPKRVPAPELSPDEISAFLAALPVMSATGPNRQAPFHVRARFVVQFETFLRSSTIERLSFPEHWAPGRTSLTITRAIDKVRWGRQLPLSAAAAGALSLACPAEPGLIFGRHEHKHWIKKAAAAAMPEWKAKLFAGAHLRSARLTHAIEQSDSLAGPQFMAGHRDLKSTARYARPSERAARNMLAKLSDSNSREGGA